MNTAAPTSSSQRRPSTLSRWLKNLAFVALLAGVASLSACGAMKAQNPSGAYSPVNAVQMNDDDRVMLKGADVVAYFTEGQYQQGSPEYKSVYEEVTFYFASPEHKQAFDAAPTQFLPQYGGYCTNGIAYGIPWGGDADIWKVVDGKLYIFGGQASKDAYELDEAANGELAKKYWAEEVKDNNSFWQRSKRLVFRVPHYKSGEELAADIAAAKAKAGQN
ncbi:YHS domain-containing (seleno)protein [Hydrogenophaga sp. 5NK40-0174]|uniref:YHS domain-containing (seleno)protein n=1 Tax=Hydrogenophaga sp. 5NK40-0174 TaxID=3127649 RepID=UPI003104B26C